MRSLVLALTLGAALYGQSAWETEMKAGNAALDPKTAGEAEEHFRAALSLASSPVEKAAALTKLGLVLETLATKNPSQAFLSSQIEPLYVQAVNLDASESADHALALELYSMLLERTNRNDEAAAPRDTAMKIRKSLATAAISHDVSTCPGPVAKIASGVSAPKLISRIEPSYSEEARLMRHQGTVLLYVVVGSNGRIIDGRLIRGLGLGLDENAMDAVGRWTFAPATKDGAPVCVSAQVEVNFRLL